MMANILIPLTTYACPAQLKTANSVLLLAPAAILATLDFTLILLIRHVCLKITIRLLNLKYSWLRATTQALSTLKMGLQSSRSTISEMRSSEQTN